MHGIEMIEFVDYKYHFEVYICTVSAGKKAVKQVDSKNIMRENI